MDKTITIERLTCECPEFNVAWQIYEDSFSENERRQGSEQADLFHNSRYWCTVIKETDAVIGLLFYWDFADYVYIDHFAIEQSKRGSGVGSVVLQQLKKRYSRIVLEIEPPDSPEKTKRKHFYEKNGFVMYDYEYYHPSFGHRHKPYRLMLMSYGFILSDNDAADLENRIDEIC